MPYKPTPPASGGTLSGTRDTIRNNFTQIETVNNVNHGAYDEADQGKHKFLQMPEQATANLLATSATEIGLYNSAVNNNLTLRSPSSGSSYQLTVYNDANIATFGSNPGWTFLPGGLIMQYGTNAAASSTGSVAFPFSFTTIYQVQVTSSRTGTGSNNNTILDTHGISNSGFSYKIDTNSGSAQINWIAIGV